MKKLILLFVFCATNLIVFSQDKSEQEVAKAVQDLRTAMINGDSAALVALTDSHLSYGHSGGQLEDQKLFVSNLASGKSDFQNMDLSEQTIAIVGKTAIVRHHLAATIVNNGTAAPVKLGVLLIWHKDNKQWKLIARQAVKI